MKYIIWIGFIMIASCANKQNANVAVNEVYLVQLENFDLNVVSALEKSLNSKTFAFQDKQIKENFKKVIKVKNISKDSSKVKVNITFFKNNNQELKLNC